MKHLNPAFLLKALWDEFLERGGFYPGQARTHNPHFLDQRGLALKCDGYGGPAYAMWGRAGLLKPETYLGKKRRRILWIRNCALDLFVQRILPHLEERFLLVTGEGDASPRLWCPQATEAILSDSRLVHWFSAQCDIAGHAKVTPMPLGMLYPYRNDVYFQRDAFGEYRVYEHDIAKFDRALAAALALRKPIRARRLMAIGDFCLNNTSRDGRFGETRSEVHRRLAENPAIFFPERPYSQHSLLKLYTEYAFVLSPFGKGLDCYRTWEAVLMGAIPIVKRSPIVPTFEGFPIVIVDDWAEVTEANLARWADQFAGHAGRSDEKLTLSHWERRIRSHLNEI